MRLEEGDRAADRGRRTAELAAGAGKAALFKRHNEDLHRIDTVHRSSPPGRRRAPTTLNYRSFDRRAEECLPNSAYSLARRTSVRDVWRRQAGRNARLTQATTRDHHAYRDVTRRNHQ